MDRYKGHLEKLHAGSGYLTQASFSRESYFRFNPVQVPPNLSIPAIFWSYLREIDRLPQSDLKSTKYKLLTEELCDFVEDVDLKTDLGLESKLVNLIKRLDPQKAKSHQKAFGGLPSNVPKGLGQISPSRVENVNKPLEQGNSPKVNFSNVKDSEKDSYQIPGSFIDLEDHTKNSHKYKVLQKPGARTYRSLLPKNPGEVSQGIAQPQIIPPKSGPLEIKEVTGVFDSPKVILQPQLYSTRFPELQTFRDLYKPIVIRYPQPDQVSREKSPFCTIDSAACQLSFKSNWNGLSFSQAEEIWKLEICVREWLIDITENIPEAEVQPNLSANSEWQLYSCPKQFFVGILRKIYIKTTDMEPAWAQSDSEMDQFLSTCTAFHTVGTTKNTKGIYAPGIDHYHRPYCMYAIRPENNPNNTILRHFMRQIVVPVEQINIIAGAKVTITPTIWDPHQSYDIIREQTTFTMSPSYLTWDKNTKSFIGTTEITKRDCTSMSVYCIIRAHTIEDLPKGSSFETMVEASLNLHIRIPDHKKQRPDPTQCLGSSGTKEHLKLDSESGSGSGFEGEPNNAARNTKKPEIPKVGGWVQTYPKWEDKLISEALGDPMLGGCDALNSAYTAPPGIIGAYGGTHPIFKQRKIARGGIISLRWDPEQWLSVIVRVKGPKEWPSKEAVTTDRPAGIGDTSKLKIQKQHINPINHAHPSEFYTDPYLSDEKTIKLVRDSIEQVEYEGHSLTLGLDIELVVTKCGERVGSRLFEEVTAVIEELPSTKIQTIKSEKPDSFGSIIFGSDSGTKDEIIRSKGTLGARDIIAGLGVDIETLRCIQWRKMVLPKIFESLVNFDNQVEFIFITSIYIGKRSGYTLREVKRIAKAFMLYGDLLDYTRMIRDETPTGTLPPDFGSSRHNPYSMNFSASQIIDSIEMAVSLIDVVEIMNPEMYDVESYRFNFSKLKSQGTIILTQKLPRSCTGVITKWIAGVLATATAAMKTENSDFDELAQAPSSWENFGLLLSNDKEGINQLRTRRMAAWQHVQ